jgi:hypothetical protein
MLISSQGIWLVGLATFISVAVAQGAETLSGSGVVISAKGEILTNAHVVNACQTITVTLASRHSELGTLVAQDEGNDLALIHLTGANNPPTSIALFREGSPVRAGDAIVALGYPLSGLLATDVNVSVGNVSALAGIADDSRYLQISAPVQPGNSGGPLLDASGHLVGIVTAKLNALRIARFTGDIPENVNFALKTEVARTFLDSKHIEYQTARSGQQQLSPADIGDLARSFTVHIECERADAQSTATAPIETFLADVLAFQGEDENAIRKGVRVALTDCEQIFRAQEVNKRMKVKAAHACHALCRSRVVEEIRQRKGTPQADHLKLVLSVIEGLRFPLKDE